MIITSLENVLNASGENSKMEFSLNGLRKGKVGMLIAAPNIGKSHLALSIGIEHSSNAKLIGLSKAESPQKVLIVSTEDDLAVLKQRMQEKVKVLPKPVQNQLKQNLCFSYSDDPFTILPDSSLFDKEQHEKRLVELTTAFASFDLVIIDTVSECIGECDEVKHDRLIKNTFQRLASKSGASILLVHHVNKEEIRGDKDITMASGAGLTTIMRLSKFIITLTNKEKEGLKLKYLKNNYITSNEASDIKLKIDNSLTINPNVYSVDPVKRVRPVRGFRSMSSVLQEPENVVLAPDASTTKRIAEQKRSVRDVL